MDLLLILRDALASSLVGGLILAVEARKAGRSVAVVLTQEALAALVQGSFEWPREMSGQEMRLALADRAKEAGLPVLGRGEGRQIDAKGLVSRAQKAGVGLYACPVWSSLLGMEDSLPEGVQALDTAAVLKMIEEARQVVGTF